MERFLNEGFIVYYKAKISSRSKINMSGNIPKIREVEKPIGEIVNTLLSHPDYMLTPNAGEGGPRDQGVDVSRENTESLNLDQYMVWHYSGDKSNIKRILRLMRMSNFTSTTFLYWDSNTWQNSPDSREAFKELEHLITS